MAGDRPVVAVMPGPALPEELVILRKRSGGKPAALCLSILAGATRHRIEPLAHVSALLTALSSEQLDWESLLPDVWMTAHPERFLTYRRDEAEAAPTARRRRRERRRAEAPEHSRSP
jgi:transposase